jgi:hypothetical protein
MKHDHKTGRPLRAGSHSTKNISIRMTDDELEALDAHVEKRRDEGATRAALIREAMDEKGLFTPVKKRG